MAGAFSKKALNLLGKQRKGVIATAVRQTSSAREDKNLLKSVYKDVPVPKGTINDFVWQHLDRWPNKIATECAVTGRRYTHEQLHKMSLTFAASLRLKLKLQNDDKVAVILPNVPEYPSIILGILKAGCITSTMNPVYTVEELKHLMHIIECKAVVASKISYANIKKALQELNENIPIILIDNENLPDGVIKFAEFAQDSNVDTDCLKSVHRNSKDVAILPFSSGTTGFPKAVELTHESMITMNEQIANPEIIVIQETTATHQSVLPAVLPFFHIFGFNALMMNQISFGCKLVTLPYFKPELFLKTLVEHRADCLFLVPPMVVFLGKHPAVVPKHLESVLGIISGAAPLSSADAEAVLAKNPNIIFRQGYGLTETNGAMTIAKNKDKNHISVGYVLGSAEVKVVDLQTQKALGPGEEGEIWYRSLSLMSSYYKNEAATKEVLTEDGWFKTGDIGKYDQDSYLYVTDRLKELIKVKGFQVAPAELETMLRQHPKVLDCAVVGMPDPTAGESPKAFVVVQQGQTLGSKEILEHVNSKVSSYKKIKDVQFVENIPKNAAGKILRKDLKKLYS